MHILFHQLIKTTIDLLLLLLGSSLESYSGMFGATPGSTMGTVQYTGLNQGQPYTKQTSLTPVISFQLPNYWF